MKAIVLFSGGIDSTVVLAYALASGRSCIALSFDYGQRHRCELSAAQTIARHYDVEHLVAHIDPAIFQGSSSSLVSDTPFSSSTFVPCRNLLFLSHASTLAQCRNIKEIFFGANQDDFANYPDCREPFFAAFQATVSHGSPPDNQISIICPLIQKTKAEIIDLGRRLHAPLHSTWSCYDPQDSHPCGRCQACLKITS